MSPPETIKKRVKRHDALLRLFARDPEAATELVLAPLPDAVRRRLPERLFEPVPTEHIDDDLELSSLDCLLLLPLSADRDLLVILEGKSSPDPQLLSQLDGYQKAARDWYRARYRGEGKKDPAILSMVAYNGQRRWNISLGLSRPEDIAWLVGHLLDGGVPTGNYVFLDLADDGWDWDGIITGFDARMMLAALVWQPDDGEEAVRELIRAVPEKSRLERRLFNYFYWERGMDDGFLERTWYDLRSHLKEDKEMRNRQDEFRAEGQQALLQKQLEGFYGPLSADALQRLAEASPEQLESWALAVPVAVRDGKGVDFVLNGALH